MTDLFIKVKTHQEQQLPFVLFCKPDSDRIVGVFQKNDHLYFLENFEEIASRQRLRLRSVFSNAYKNIFRSKKEYR